MALGIVLDGGVQIQHISLPSLRLSRMACRSMGAPPRPKTMTTSKEYLFECRLGQHYAVVLPTSYPSLSGFRSRQAGTCRQVLVVFLMLCRVRDYAEWSTVRRERRAPGRTRHSA